MYGCQQVLINPDNELKAILEFVCEQSNKLANCGIYYTRQLFFKTGKLPSKYDLHKLLKGNPHFQALYSHVAQQTLTSEIVFVTQTSLLEYINIQNISIT